MKHFIINLAICLAISNMAKANDSIILSNTNNNVSLSIYNQNLALVKDIRKAKLENGTNNVVFDGVAEKIQPETAIIYSQDIKVIEQNYSYNLMTYNNLIEQFIGKEVNTVRENPKNGDNILEKATILGSVNGKPILKFSYGIDNNFPGRILFDNIPNDVSNKPILTAKLTNNKSEEKNLYLAYLTSGISWKTDYVANVINKENLDLTGWVTINNESGVDYENAKIQLVAGNVNNVRNVMNNMPRMMMVKAYATSGINNMEDSITPETVSSYELYTIPYITSIKDKQTKQLSLIEKKSVKYTKEFNLNSPLYFGGNNEFEKNHPDITYVIKNDNASNLGISLPGGTIRFYENDKNGNLQFIGSNTISNTPKDEKLNLNLGEAFNIVISGKITQIKEKETNKQPSTNNCFLVSKLKTYDASITINNAEKNENTIIIKQNVPDTAKVTNENIKSVLENANTRKWEVKVPAESKGILTFQLDYTDKDRICY